MTMAIQPAFLILPPTYSLRWVCPTGIRDPGGSTNPPAR